MRRSLDDLFYCSGSFTIVILLILYLSSWFQNIYTIFDNRYNLFEVLNSFDVCWWFRRLVVEAKIVLLAFKIWTFASQSFLSGNRQIILFIFVFNDTLKRSCNLIYLFLDITHQLDVYSRRNSSGPLNLIFKRRLLRSSMCPPHFVKLVVKRLILQKLIRPDVWLRDISFFVLPNIFRIL